jgi:hypothetical protein
MVQIALFIAIIFIMTFTPLGYLRLGILEIFRVPVTQRHNSHEKYSI